jgi:glycosyltransferase involved in cell wall biosynthesis
MGSKLFYCPLESYKERYTYQLSAPGTGWLERHWIEDGIPYVRVNSLWQEQAPDSIGQGQVLDAVRRGKTACGQVRVLLDCLAQGAITSEDVIYFDDFWHPGLEAMPYAFHLTGVRPRMYAFLYAQSVDRFDFTYPMRHWMRHFERGIGEVLDGIFVATPTLKDLVVAGGIAPPEKVHVVGLIFDTEEVLSRMPRPYRDWRNYVEGARPPERKNRVVFSSRWDQEKNPEVFCRIAQEVWDEDPDVEFVVCTSADRLRSNCPHLLDLARAMTERRPKFTILSNLTKEEYYAVLCGSKVQLNTADQDWISFTLLEAVVAGCWPVYPNTRSFPETFQGSMKFLYPHRDPKAAAGRILAVLEDKCLWELNSVEARLWIANRFDSTWQRMLQVMGFGRFSVRGGSSLFDPPNWMYQPRQTAAE